MSAALGRKSKGIAASGYFPLLSPVRADTMRQEPLPVTGNTLAGKNPLFGMLGSMSMHEAVNLDGVRHDMMVAFVRRGARRNMIS